MMRECYSRRQSGRITLTYGLRVQVGAELDVSVLFGLEVSIGALFVNLVEVFMENSIAFVACIWCEVAFLRGPGGENF